MPTDADVAAVVTERVTALLEARFRERYALKVERMQRFKARARSLSENTDEAELIAMLLDDYYQQLIELFISQKKYSSKFYLWKIDSFERIK